MALRFPKLTETFVLYEMLALEQQGVRVELYPLLRERTTVMHPEAAAMVERAHFRLFLSWPILRAQMRFLRLKAARLHRRAVGAGARHLGQPELLNRRAGHLSQDGLLRRADGGRRRAARSRALREPPSRRWVHHLPAGWQSHTALRRTAPISDVDPAYVTREGRGGRVRRADLELTTKR